MQEKFDELTRQMYEFDKRLTLQLGILQNTLEDVQETLQELKSVESRIDARIKPIEEHVTGVKSIIKFAAWVIGSGFVSLASVLTYLNIK